MALSHAQPGQVIDIRPLGAAVAATKTATLAKTASFELIRLSLPAGKHIAEHHVAGEILVQGLEGEVEFTAGGKTQRLAAGQMLFLSGGESHALAAITDASVLVTILLR
jgi:quercetin dioxygenase-like cupin family protein